MKKLHSKSWLPWAIWLVATGFVLFQFFLQLCSGPIVVKLMHSFSITAFGASILSSTYYYIYVIMQVPSGMLIDRFGARILLTLGALFCAAGCFFFAFTHLFYIAELGRILMGGGSAFAYVGALYLIGRWFPITKFAFLIGLIDMIGAFTSLFANMALAVSVQQHSWRYSMVVSGVFTLVLAVFCWVIIRDTPENYPAQEKQTNMTVFLKHVKEIFSNHRLWLYGLYIGILYGIECVFSGLWGIPYTELLLHVSNSVATFLVSLTFVGLGLCCPIMGWMFPKIKRPRLMMSNFAIISMIISVVAIYFPPHSLILYGALMFLMGASVSVYVFTFALVQKIVSEDARTTAIGFLNMLCVGTVPIIQPLVGFLMHRSATTSSNNIDIYTIQDYHNAFVVIPLLFLLAAMIPLWLRNKASVSCKKSVPGMQDCN